MSGLVGCRNVEGRLASVGSHRGVHAGYRADGRARQPAFFDAYGKPLVTYSGDDRYRLQPLQYKGQAGYYSDAYAGLHYCLHRYYDPRTGRWTQRDPIGLEGGINVYAYCGGNPVKGVDPSGLLDTDWGPKLGWAGLRIGLGYVPGVGVFVRAWSIGSEIDDQFGLSEELGDYYGGWFDAQDDANSVPAVASHHANLIRKWNNSSGVGRTDLEAQHGWLANYAMFQNAGVPFNSIQIHHLLPQTLRGWFGAKRINVDDDRFLLPLITNHHKVVHGKGGPVNWMNWNREWTDFRNQNGNATPKQILRQLQSTRARYGL